MNEINKRYNLGMSIQDKYNSKTMRIILNDWINYYNQYLKINNNQGVKTMLNNIIKPSRIIKSYKIFNRLKSIINKVFENVGYFFIGYKVDIEQNQSDILEAKAKIRILRNTQSHNIDDIQTLTKDVEVLMTNTRFCKSWVIKNGDNIKAIEKYVSKKFVKIELHMANTEQIKTLKKEVEALKDYINLTNERGQDGTK